MLGWYVKRLSVMSPTEIAHRVGEAWAIRRMRRRHERTTEHDRRDPSQFGFCGSTVPRLPKLPWEFRLSPEEVERLHSGRWSALGFDWCWEDDARVWHRAPDTGERWPSTFFGDIPYRVSNPYGDIRVAWEPARLQQLIDLALLVQEREEATPRAVRLLESILASWTEANPPLAGIHYISAMECALRLIAVCHAVDMVRARLTEPERTWRAVLEIVGSHAPLIAQRLSLHSSAGNHTVAEGTGIVFAGVLFPEFSDAHKWKAIGLGLLEREAARQVLSDGGGIEQAFWYQLFIVDLFGLAQAMVERHGETVPKSVADAVQRGRRYLNAFTNCAAGLPAIGDSDNGYALSRHLRISWNRDASQRERRTTFPDAGYTVLSDNAPVPFRIVFDHGSFGMPPSYGHGHADALSVCLTVNDQDLLIDPGTFTYTGDQKWRQWFRSTSAHNTVTVDRQDQARQVSAFQWSNCPTARLVRSDEQIGQIVHLLAMHDGYRRVGVVHWRGVVRVSAGWLIVWDYLAGMGRHLAELHWHLGVAPRQVGDGFILEAEGAVLGLYVSGGTVSVHRGELEPPLGWRSPMYGVREPATTIKVCHESALPYEFVTSINLAGMGQPGAGVVDEAVARLRAWVRESELPR